MGQHRDAALTLERLTTLGPSLYHAEPGPLMLGSKGQWVIIACPQCGGVMQEIDAQSPPTETPIFSLTGREAWHTTTLQTATPIR